MLEQSNPSPIEQFIIDSVKAGNMPDKITEMLNERYPSYTFSYDAIIKTPLKVKIYWLYQPNPVTLCETVITEK